jgi:hypothetical protein
MDCKMALVLSEFWLTLAVESNKWLLNELKSQQQEDDTKERSSGSEDKDKTKITNIDKINSNLPNKFVRVKNAVKGEEKL